MSGHRRVKALAYDDDDIDDGYSDDDYGEEGYGDDGGEMTAEDREQMREGTLKVKEALPPGMAVPDKEIQEALWNYYYDVPKSVTYLKNKYAPKQKAAPQPKAPKAASRFDQAASSAAKASTTKQSGPVPAYPLILPEPLYEEPRISAADFFKDTPWLNVPEYRRGNLTAESRYPRGGLLGGSSKLAALAAARKKKQQEQQEKAAAAAASSTEEQSKQADRALSLLDRLGGKSGKDAPTPPTQPFSRLSIASQQTPPAQSVSQQSTGAKGSRNDSSSPPKQVQPPHSESKPSSASAEQATSEATPSSQKRSRDEGTTTSEEKPPLPMIAIVPKPQATPSTFASAILGASHSRPAKRTRHQDSSISLYELFPACEIAKVNPFAGPSPDDVVLNAQAQAKGNKANKGSSKASKNDPAASSVSDGVASLAIDETPRIKSKNLDVLKEYEKSNLKRAANFVVIGHVDHGKSTLMGRLLYDLKVVDQRSVDKLRKEAENIGKSSFAFAWVMDQTSEERSRGVTVDIATNNFETEKTRFTILDAPGHKDFIPNMIAGTSQADFAVLVIDAGTNSFESGLRGQTKEHALLARSIGVQRLIVAVNKMDTINWSQERFNEISQQMTAFLTSAGFQQKNLAFVPCAGLTGENIVKKPSEGTIPWYDGRTLLEELDASEPAKRAIEKPLRMTISDVFRGGITNPLSISGRLDTGSLQAGDQVIAMPSGEKAFIKGVEADGEPADWAVAGQIVVLHLTDIDPVHLRLGDIICSPSDPIRNVKTFTAKILAFEHVTPMYVDVHRGRLNVSAQIKKLVSTLDKSSGEVIKKKPRIVKPGSVARVEVEMTNAIPLEVGTRVVLRAEGMTVAAGLLEKTG